MSDIATLIERIELLRDGQPLPGDETPSPVLGNKGAIAHNTASLRCSSIAVYAKVQPINRRLACELIDNVETILAALQYWRERQASLSGTAVVRAEAA